MSQLYECYRYAAPGERQLKYHHGTRQQQVRYLPGVEIRTCSSTSRLRVIAAGNSHIYQSGSQTFAHFNLADRLGSLSGVVNEDGVLVSSETWYPFGGTASWLTGMQAGAALKFRRYVNKERDATGLMFYNWRYYVPWQMRWLNSDPAGTVDGLNLFCMVGNNPVTLRDLDGRMKNSDDEGALNLSVKDKQPTTETRQIPLPPKKRACWRQIASDPVEPLPGVSTDTELPPSLPAPAPLPSQEAPQPGPSTDPKPKRTSATSRAWCRICNPAQRFDSYHLRDLHCVNEHNLLFRCDYANCTKVFKNKQKLTIHKGVHSDVRQHVCGIDGCQKSFKHKANLYNHKRTHDQSKKYKCEQCNIDFKSADSLRQHNIRTKSHTVPYPCEQCGTIFYTGYQLKLHNMQGHGLLLP